MAEAHVSFSSSESGSDGEEDFTGVAPEEEVKGEGNVTAESGEGSGTYSPVAPAGIDMEEVSDDEEMASAVASAGHQASKFLQDSDSEEEQEKQEPVVKEGASGTKEDFDNVFGEESDDEGAAIPVRSKRLLSSGDEEGGVGGKSSPKRQRLSDTREDGDEGGVKELGEAGDRAGSEGASVGGGGEKEEGGSDVGEEGGSSGEGVSGVGLQEELVEGEEEEEGGLVGEGGGEGGGEPGSDEDDLDDEKKGLLGMSDWDIMMERRKAAMARARRRRRRDGDLTVNDDHIMALIQQMKDAAQQDRQLNLARKAATKKIQLLSTVVAHLKKSDLQTTFIECGILSVLAEWLTPLPDHSLPHLKIREAILDVLKSYPVPDSSILKSSKIGKAVMLLYRHPKEAKKNKLKAGKIINEWARPIFGLASDFKSMTRDEREKRDYANLSESARRRISSGERRPSQDDDSEQPQKPGDKGWVGRARVPMPSTKGYIVRPKWNVDQDQYLKRTPSKKSLDRYEKHVRKKRQQNMQSKTAHAVPISIEGRHMPL